MRSNLPTRSEKPKISSTSFGLFVILSGLFLLSGVPALYRGLAGPSGDTSQKDMIFGSIFTLLGFAFIYLGIRLKSFFKQTEDLVERYPNEPWMWREDWAQGMAFPNEKKQTTTLLLASIAILFVTGGLAFAILVKRLGNHPGPVFYATLFFPTVSILMLYSALRQKQKMSFVKPSSLQFDICGVLGGKFIGRLNISSHISESANIVVRIANKHTFSNRNDSENSHFTKIIWQADMNVLSRQNGKNRELLIEVDIPFDTMPTSETNQKFGQVYNLSASQAAEASPNTLKKSLDSYNWDIAIQIDSTDLKAKVTYDVPVFKTAKSDPTKLRRLEIENLEISNEIPKTKSMIIKSLPEGLEIRFIKNKAAVVSIFLGVFGLVFLGIGLLVGTIILKINGFALLALPVPIVLSFVGTALFAFALVSGLQKVHIIINDSELQIYNSYLGYTQLIKIPMNCILKTEISHGTQQGDQVWYDIKIHGGRRLPITISAALSDKMEALWIAKQIEIRTKAKSAS